MFWWKSNSIPLTSELGKSLNHRKNKRLNKMYYFAVTLAILSVCVSAQISTNYLHEEEYPHVYKISKQSRHPRDVSWDKQVGNGKVFGTLGNDDSGLFGKGGYKQDIFNDHRGKLTGEAYGSRVLGPYGDSSHLGGRLDWANKNANAALDVNRQIGGHTSLQATGSGVWKIDKNTDLSGGAMFRQERFGHGRPDVGLQGNFQHRW